MTTDNEMLLCEYWALVVHGGHAHDGLDTPNWFSDIPSRLVTVEQRNGIVLSFASAIFFSKQQLRSKRVSGFS